MWKVGDRVRFVENGRIDSDENNGFIKGKIYKIFEVVKGGQKDYRCEEGYTYAIDKNNQNLASWWIEPNSFRLIKTNPVNEIEWLDRIQDNFREGY